MSNIALEAKTKEHKLLKSYLEANASECLIEKINKGVKIEKDGKTLINKKTLSGFMKYAASEAKKQAEKGATSACVRSDLYLFSRKKDLVCALPVKKASSFRA